MPKLGAEAWLEMIRPIYDRGSPNDLIDRAGRTKGAGDELALAWVTCEMVQRMAAALERIEALLSTRAVGTKAITAKGAPRK